MMAPHFEEAAKELEGKVRFVKMDTDKEPDMAARLNIMGLPTLMFLDEVAPKDGEEAGGATAALKNKIEGAISKQTILELCDYHFFDGPVPATPN
jgi:thiol-disulfide isomerase/thioredoxin